MSPCRLDTVAAGLQTRRSRHRGAVARHAVSGIALALCLGIGLSSLTSIALVAIGISPATRSFVLTDIAIWVSVAAVGWWTRRRWSAQVRARSRESRAESLEPKAEIPEPRPDSREPSNLLDWIVRAAFGVTALAALAAVTSFSRPRLTAIGTPGRSGTSTRDSSFAAVAATPGEASLRSPGRSPTTRCCCRHRSRACGHLPDTSRRSAQRSSR